MLNLLHKVQVLVKLSVISGLCSTARIRNRNLRKALTRKRSLRNPPERPVKVQFYSFFDPSKWQCIILLLFFLSSTAWSNKITASQKIYYIFCCWYLLKTFRLKWKLDSLLDVLSHHAWLEHGVTEPFCKLCYYHFCSFFLKACDMPSMTSWMTMV